MKVQVVLLEYLMDVMYHEEGKELDIKKLPEEFKAVGNEMAKLGKWIKEAKETSKRILKGDLSSCGFDKGNPFMYPLIELQHKLNYITWQIKQVENGDYTQKIDFIEEFSNAFNSLTNKLQQQRDSLTAEKQLVEDINDELDIVVQLVKSFANYTHNMVFIRSIDGRKELFRNISASNFINSNLEMGEYLLKELEEKDDFEIHSRMMWDFEFKSVLDQEEIYYYNVESYPMIMNNHRAVVHIVLDDTKRKKKEKHMHQLAYVDALTGLYNRRYAFEMMNHYINQNVSFVLSFVDIDYLKYCNDKFGHILGDTYLLDIVKALKEIDGILCRTGGDEFMIIQANTTTAKQNELLYEIRERVQEEGKTKLYPQSYSYASCEIPMNPTKKLDEYLILVDALMYEFKAKNKKTLKDTLYHDDRTL